MPSWVMPGPCTQWGQPHKTWPSRKLSKSASVGLGINTMSDCANSSSRGHHPTEQAGDAGVRDPESLAVATLDEHAVAQRGVDALEVEGVDGRAELVLFAGVADDAEDKVGHGASLRGRPS